MEMIKPHFLRRMKDEVEDSIPPLSETVVDVELQEAEMCHRFYTFTRFV